MKSNIDYSLYLVTDRELMTSETVEESAELAIKGGCTVVQLREKSISSREFYDTALKLREVTQRYGIPLIINDRADIALAVNAEGLHIGQSDIPMTVARRIMGGDAIIGVSVCNTEEAVTAQEAGADYIGVGAMFPTGTKEDADYVSMEELSRIRTAVSIPIVVIGGINKQNAASFAGSGIQGLAVVSAVVARDDIAGAARELRECLKYGG